MLSQFNKKSAGVISIALFAVVALLTGCSGLNNESKASAALSSIASTVSASSSSGTGAVSQNSQNAILQSSSRQDDPAKVLLESIKELAVQGKILNCEFAVKSGNMSDVEDKWGEADKSDYVASAKGTYDTYSNKNVVFGYNKGAQIFEVRSFDKQLSQITMSMIKDDYGAPMYDHKSKSEEVIGYKVTDQFKILFVFPLPTSSNSNPQLNHYSVFYPAGTINSMAGDPGREW